MLIYNVNLINKDQPIFAYQLYIIYLSRNNSLKMIYIN